MTDTPPKSPSELTLQQEKLQEVVQDKPASQVPQKEVVQQKNQSSNPKLNLPPVPIDYHTCTKGGFHQNQRLSLVCLQSKCQNDPLLCVICLQEDHFGHKVNSLRLVVQAARKKALNTIQPSQIEQLNQVITDSNQNLNVKYLKFNTQVSELVTNIKQAITDTHNKINYQIQLKLDGQKTINYINELNKHEIKGDTFVQFVRNLKEGVPEDWDQDEINEDGNQEQIKNSIEQFKTNLGKKIDLTSKTINQAFISYQDILTSVQSKGLLSKQSVQYTFSSEMKHHDISIVSPTIVTTQNSTGLETYRFALMEPSLEVCETKKQKFSFKIQQNSKDWIAIGIAHKQTIEKHKYTFNYSQLNHGAYLISSNGGSWSSLDSAQNNVVTAFQFYKDDIITVEYDPETMIINFQKQATGQTYSLSFKFIQKDQLHLCALFYYNDDKLQYLGKDETK